MMSQLTPENVRDHIRVSGNLGQKEISDSVIKKTIQKFKELNSQDGLDCKVAFFYMSGRRAKKNDFIKLVDDPNIEISNIEYHLNKPKFEEDMVTPFEDFIYTITVFYTSASRPVVNKIITDFKEFQLPGDEKEMGKFLTYISKTSVPKEYKKDFLYRRSEITNMDKVYKNDGTVTYFFHTTTALSGYIKGIQQPALIPITKDKKNNFEKLSDLIKEGEGENA